MYVLYGIFLLRILETIFLLDTSFFSSNDFECLEGVQESMDELMN